MKCCNCLIWQRKGEELKALDFELLPNLTHFLHKAEVGRIAESAYVIIKEVKERLRSLVSVMDVECPPNKCIFLEENYLK